MCKISSKLFLLVTGALFWATAVFLFFLGGYIFYQYKDVERIAESTHVLVPASVLIAVGIFLFLLGVVGVVGACKEQKCLLGFFFIILLLIFCGLITACVLSFVYRNQATDTLKKGFEEGLKKYGKDDVWTEDMDFYQSTFQCCGSNNYTDYENTTWYNQSKPYPDSCCKHYKCNFTQGHNPNTTGVFVDGCYKKLHQSLHGHFVILLGVAAALVVFQVLGMIASCVLLCRRRSEIPYIGLVEPGSMRA